MSDPNTNEPAAEEPEPDDTEDPSDLDPFDHGNPPDGAYPTGETPASFAIDSFDLADWAARKVARARRVHAQHMEAHAASAARLDAHKKWADEQLASAAGRLEQLLADFHARVLDQARAEGESETGLPKTLRLPSGAKLTSRAETSPHLLFDDDEPAVAARLARTGAREVVRYPAPQLDRNAIKSLIPREVTVAWSEADPATGELADFIATFRWYETADGQAIAGVRYDPPGRTYRVDTPPR